MKAVYATGVRPATLEFLDRISVEAVEKAIGFGAKPEEGALLLMEVDGADAALDAEVGKIKAACEGCGVITFRKAETEEEREDLWKARRALSFALTEISSEWEDDDVSVPIARIPQMIRKLDEIAERHDIIIANFGHYGDGNIHIGMTTGKDGRPFPMVAKDEVVQAVVELEGRIAAEHGIGCVKAHNLRWNIDEPTLAMMRSFKALLDPNGILNPGKVMPQRGVAPCPQTHTPPPSPTCSSWCAKRPRKCIRCGECRTVCPVFREEPAERYTARGKMANRRGAGQGHHRIDPARARGLRQLPALHWLREPVFQRGARRQGRHGRAPHLCRQAGPAAHEKAARRRTGLPRRGHGRGGQDRRGPAAAALQGRARGQRPAAPLRPYPWPTARSTCPRSRPRASAAASRSPGKEGQPRVMFFTGCMINYAMTEIGDAVVKVLNAVDVSVEVPGAQGCCGMPMLAGGDAKAVRKQALRNVEALAGEGDSPPIITACASGGHMLKHGYLDLLGDDPVLAAKLRKHRRAHHGHHPVPRGRGGHESASVQAEGRPGDVRHPTTTPATCVRPRALRSSRASCWPCSWARPSGKCTSRKHAAGWAALTVWRTWNAPRPSRPGKSATLPPRERTASPRSAPAA